MVSPPNCLISEKGKPGEGHALWELGETMWLATWLSVPEWFEHPQAPLGPGCKPLWAIGQPEGFKAKTDELGPEPDLMDGWLEFRGTGMEGT